MSFNFFGKMSLPLTISFFISNFLYKLTQSSRHPIFENIKFHFCYFFHFVGYLLFPKKNNFLCVSIVVDYADTMSAQSLTTLTHVCIVFDHAVTVFGQLLTTRTHVFREYLRENKKVHETVLYGAQVESFQQKKLSKI